MIQIITYDKNKFKDFDNKYKISELDEFNSFDDYEINIIDLSNENIWYYDSSTISSINHITDFISLKREIETSKKCKIVIVFPQNCSFHYHFSDYQNRYLNFKKIKDIISIFTEIISKNLFNIEGFDISYSKNKTIIDDCSYESDFNFNFNEITPNSYTIITKSNGSEKCTSMIYKNLIVTSLDIFVSVHHFKKFVAPLVISNNKISIPDWINDINFFDDKKLKENKLKNNNEIKILQEKNTELDLKLDNNNKFKSILYTSGNELVEVVMKILDEMLDNDSSKFVDEKKEDFLIKKENITFVGEIKGISSAVANKNVSQLDVHVQDYIDKIANENIKENVKGLLIINHQRDKDLKDRNEVHQNQIDLAKRNGSLIIESNILLVIYEKFLLGKLEKDSILKILSEKVGVLKEKDLK